MTPLETSRILYAHVAAGDWDAVDAMLTDDFVIYEPESLPYGGEWRGRDALRRLYAHVMGYWENPKVEWLELVGGETYAVALLRFGMTARATGKRIDTTVSEVTRFDGDRIADMRIHYFDTATMLVAMTAE